MKKKDKLISNILLRIPSHGHDSVGRPARTYIHLNCADTGCSLEDLPGTFGDWDDKREPENTALSAQFDDDNDGNASLKEYFNTCHGAVVN